LKRGWNRAARHSLARRFSKDGIVNLNDDPVRVPEMRFAVGGLAIEVED
jgi:hypothetical protein